jgi:hypothetical protein
MSSKNIAIYVIVIIIVIIIIFVTKKSNTLPTATTTSRTYSSINPTSFSNMSTQSSLSYPPEVLKQYDILIKKSYQDIQLDVQKFTTMKDSMLSYINSPNQASRTLNALEEKMLKHSSIYLQICNLGIKIGSLIHPDRQPNIREKAQILDYLNQGMQLEIQIPKSNDESQTIEEQEEQKLQSQADQIESQVLSLRNTLISNLKTKKQAEILIDQQEQHLFQLIALPTQLQRLRQTIVLHMQHLDELKQLSLELQTSQSFPQTTQSMK